LNKKDLWNQPFPRFLKERNFPMGMTITEKILARHAGLEQVTPGQIIEVDVDLLMINDVSGPLAVQAFKSTGRDRVFDPSRLVIVLDHYVPNVELGGQT